jgi:hypothetical protein
LRAHLELPQQGTEGGRVGVAHLRRDLLDALRCGAQQVGGALGPQTLHDRERAHANRGLGASLEGATGSADRGREIPDVQRLAQVGAGLLLEVKDQRIVVVEVVHHEVGALGDAFIDDQKPGNVLGQTRADSAHQRKSQVYVGERGASGHDAAVGDHHRPLIEGHRWIPASERGAEPPARRGPAHIEEPGLSQGEDAGARSGDRGHIRVQVAQDLMLARVGLAASALSVSSAVIVPSAGTTTTSAARSSRGCIVTGTVRPAPVATLRPVPMTSTRIGGIEGSTPGRWASAVDRMSMRAVNPELKHPSLASNPTCMAQMVAKMSYAPLAGRARLF